MYKHLFIHSLILCCALAVPCRAQHTLSGSVTGTTGQPLDYVTVILHALPDSSLVKGAITDSLGTYSFSPVNPGAYYIEYSATGFAPQTSPAITLTASTTLPAVKLAATTQQLTGVNVTARRALVVRKPDRTIINVDAMLTAAGQTALDALEKSPGVQVDPDGNISLKGKQGVNVFINDKPAYLSGAELANYLRSLPSSAIDQLELMTNPPAGYDAAGSAGIINIKLKRKGLKGFFGGVNLAATRGQLTRTNNSVNLNYRNNKINTYLNAGYNNANYFTDLDLNRVYKNGNTPLSYFEQKSYFLRHAEGLMLNTGLDYNPTDKTTFGIVLTGNSNRSHSENDNRSYLFNDTYQPDSTIKAQNNNQSRFTNGGINLNYRHQFGSNGHSISADADYLNYNTLTTQQFTNNYYPAISTGTPLYTDMLGGNLPNNINIYSFKADHVVPLPHNIKLSSGIKTSYTITNNQADYTITKDNITNPDYSKSNHFIYREQINAAYTSAAWEGRKLSVQAGLRVENTISNGHQLGNPQKPDSAFNRHYTNAFPTVYLSYKLDTLANNQFNLNYGRRINRPYYEDLNPFINPMDKFTYYVGNPFLKPSLINTIELAYTYKNKITAGINYSKSHDDINETIEINNGIYYSRSGNIGSKTTITASLDADFDPFKWLNLHTYAEAGDIHSRSAFYNGTLDTRGTYWFISGMARIKLGHGWDGEVNANYRSTITDAQFVIKPLWAANAAVRKKINNAASLKLTINDIFYSQKVIGHIGSLTGADASWINRRDSRCVTLIFSYNFGKPTGNNQRNRSGAEDEKNRVKN